MKLLLIADKKPQKSIKQIIVENPNIDAIITLGDLEIMDIFELGEINHIPKIGVYGNHCDGLYMKDLGITNLHMKSLDIKGNIFGGFEGSIKYKESKYAKMYSQEEAFNLIGQLEKCDILITHNPPFGVQDNKDPSHIGFKGLNKYIEKKSPKYLFHGHTYPDIQETIVGNTKVVYVHSYKIFEI